MIQLVLRRIFYALGLGILLLANLARGTEPAPRPGSVGEISASLKSGIALAMAEASPAEEVILRRISSRETDGRTQLFIQVERGLAGPLRQGPFVVVNGLQVTLQSVRVTAVYPADQEMEPKASPLSILSNAFQETLRGFFPEAQPREPTIFTVAKAATARRIGRVVFEPLEAGLVTGDQRVELLAASALWSSGADDLHITGLTLKTAGGQRLEADEATLKPNGNLFILGPYGLFADTEKSQGESAVFTLTPDGSRLVNRGPLPLGAIAPWGTIGVSTDLTWTAILSPVSPRIVPVDKATRRPGRT